MVEEVLLAIVDELVEKASGLLLLPQRTVAKCGVENLVGLGIVVVHGSGGFGGSCGPLFVASKEIKEVVFLRTVELALAEVRRVDEALLQQALGRFIVMLRKGLLRQLHPAYLVLCRHLTFAALPGMKLVGIKFPHRFLMAPKLVEQGDLLEQQVVALLNQFRVFLQEVETLLVRTMQTLVELVEFHQHTGVGLVEVERFLHIGQGFVLALLLVGFADKRRDSAIGASTIALAALFVEAGQGEVTPYGGKRRVELRRALPVLDGDVVLPFVVVKTAQIVGCPCTVRVECLGSL